MNTVSVIIGIFAIGAITGIWYITQPMAWKMIDQAESVTITMGANRTGSATMYTMLKYLCTIWGPALAIAILAWMIISAQREDFSSQYTR